ncbi:MAG: tripartite tricarboxylate transporter TctB family protein [Xanthomonadales bacterium]|jgi:hypothetical protein|nr:tripartite tricarboxylate transporter TctB family protein [Xanthomonadales bacterium]
MRNKGLRKRFTLSLGLTVLISALLGLMLWQSLYLSAAAGWIPRVVLVFTLFLALLQCALDWRYGGALQQHSPSEKDGARRRRVLAALAWIGSLLACILLLGTIAGSVVFSFAWFRWQARERLAVSLLMAAGLGLVLWTAFAFLLGVSLFPGLFFEAVF